MPVADFFGNGGDGAGYAKRLPSSAIGAPADGDRLHLV